MASDGAAMPLTAATMAVDTGVSCADGPLGRVDLAWRSRGQLLVYGWVLGLATSISRAILEYGDVSVDLREQVIRVPRPDVTSHYPERVYPDDNYHGFYVLVDLPDADMPDTRLRMFLAASSGATSESYWSASGDPSGLLAALRGLIRQIPQREVQRLTALTGQPMGLETPAAVTPTHFHVDLCCIFGQRLLLVGGQLSNLQREITSIELVVGQERLDLLGEAVPVAFSAGRPESELSSGSGNGFFCLWALNSVQNVAEVAYTIRTPSREARQTRAVTTDDAQMRGHLLSLVSTLEAESVLTLTGRVRSELERLQLEPSVGAFLGVLSDQAAERLPSAFQHLNPRIELHADHGLRVGNQGVFVRGWFYAQSGAGARVTCEWGSGMQGLDDRWIRDPRPDVTAYLANQGMECVDDNHGFLCFVRGPLAQAPCHLAVTLTPTRHVRRARINVVPADSSLQAMRLVLRSFNTRGDQLRPLFDDHVGPAVAAIWAAHREIPRTIQSRQFGTSVPDPRVSIIVVLQEDSSLELAEQLSSFAVDSDFQREELIYVVEDPGVYEHLCRRCADFHDRHRIPFTVLCVGALSGFAGAANRAAELARGRKLLFLGDDVRPRSADWLKKLAAVYEEQPFGGVLGVKLLNENGSVREAGVEFRRRPDWAGFWDAYCPTEGQSAASAGGVREVEAVSAACLMIDIDLYRQLGGFCEDYIRREFADSDLALRAGLAGRRNRVALDIELFYPRRPPRHISGDAIFDAHLTLFNCWLHHQRWAQLIGSRSQMVRSRE